MLFITGNKLHTSYIHIVHSACTIDLTKVCFCCCLLETNEKVRRYRAMFNNMHLFYFYIKNN